MTDTTNPLPSVFQMIVGAIARHLLTAVAGGLAAAAGLSSDQQTQFVTGGAAVVVWLAGVAWSAWQKRSVSKTITLPPLPADLPPT